ncbi:MAG: DUF58 domain-containing protein [Proteobacteria bacterium]|nr:DUF58 domain-containing protein [Pseudomonadota bacterium]
MATQRGPHGHALAFQLIKNFPTKLLGSLARRLGALRRAKPLWTRWADWFPLTPLGLLFVAGAAFVLRVMAHAQLDMVLLVVGYAGLGLGALSLAAVALGALGLRWRLRRQEASEAEPLLAETAASLPTSFELPALTWLPLLHLDWQWLEPEGVEVQPETSAARRAEQVRFQRRGQFRRTVRRIVVSDVFGLAALGLRQQASLALDVLPHLGKLARTPVLRSLSGGDDLPHPMGVESGDRLELHRYVPGDPARFIHWKAYGRTRKLMIRKPERALAQAQRTAGYLVAGPLDEASAAVARMALERNLLGRDWVFGSDEDPFPVTRLEAALATLMRSGGLHEQGALGLEEFLRQAERSGPVSAVVFVPAQPGSWLDRAVAASRKPGRTVRFVVGVDGIASASQPTHVARLLLLPQASGHTPAAPLREVLRRLGETRCQVSIYDRVSGRQLSELHLRDQGGRQGVSGGA